MSEPTDRERESPSPSARGVWAAGLRNVLRPTHHKRRAAFLLGDTACIFLSFFLAFCLRLEFAIPDAFVNVMWVWMPVVVLMRVVFLYLGGLYAVSWRFVGLREFLTLAKVFLASALLLWLANVLVLSFAPYLFVPRGVLVIDAAFAFLFVGIFRVSKRLYLHGIGMHHGKRTVVVGAGRAGERLVRELLRSKVEAFHPVAFVDDNSDFHNTTIHGVPVLGDCDAVGEIAAEERIEAAIIALPSSSHERIREVFRKLSGIHDVKVVPSIAHLGKDAIAARDIKTIRLEDLLPRETVTIDDAAVKELVSGQTVMVTGSGGSIGSEIVRQALRYGAERVVAFEVDETELHTLGLEIANDRLVPFLGDVRDRAKVEIALKRFSPAVVFHAAAYKHVPMMEWFPEEAVRTNSRGTFELAKACAELGVREFVNISTDKAVNPTSVMGATKRIAEMACRAVGGANTTKFVSVRFGNVLGSRGSVIPTFLHQIGSGGPITITHPEMKRYFMSIPEAVLLVFQAAAMGKGGEVFVLDMGEPVMVRKVAEDLIRLHGLVPHEDIKLVYTGMRPGEKLFEELLTAEEGTDATTHAKVFVARNGACHTPEKVDRIIADLEDCDHDHDRIKQTLRKHVPFYEMLKG